MLVTKAACQSLENVTRPFIQSEGLDAGRPIGLRIQHLPHNLPPDARFRKRAFAVRIPAGIGCSAVDVPLRQRCGSRSRPRGTWSTSSREQCLTLHTLCSDAPAGAADPKNLKRTLQTLSATTIIWYLCHAPDRWLVLYWKCQQILTGARVFDGHLGKDCSLPALGFYGCGPSYAAKHDFVQDVCPSWKLPTLLPLDKVPSI